MKKVIYILIVAIAIVVATIKLKPSIWRDISIKWTEFTAHRLADSLLRKKRKNASN